MGADNKAMAGQQERTSKVAMLPQDIQAMTRQQLEQSATASHFYVTKGDSDEFLQFTIYFARQGYDGRSASLAASFQWGYELATDPDLYAAEAAWAEEWAALNKQPIRMPRAWRSLREFEQAHPPKPDLIRIVGRCGAMRKQLETAGAHTGYEVWRATLSILKFTEAGHDDIKALTGGHAEYDPTLTAYKMADISAPFLCDTFSYEHTAECTACKYRGNIRSPIGLGFQREPKAKKGGRQ